MNYHNNKKEEKDDLDLLLRVGKTTLPFEVPVSYFEYFTARIISAVTAADAENDPDTELFSGSNVFSLPQGYFETLPAIISDRIREADDIIIKSRYSWNSEDKNLPYHLPERYFEHFEQELSEKLFHSETEIEELPALLDDLRKVQPLSVPAGYFPQNMLRPVIAAKKPELKVKAIEHPSVKSIRWASWAAAVAVIFILSMGGWHFLGNTSNINSPSLEQKLAQVPESDIQNYINNNLEEFDVNMIENSISQTTKNDMAASALSGISDAEIEAYLNGDI